MGTRITIDSASMFNKSLELIEAMHLFKLDFSDVEVIIHPQSIIHSMVNFNDGFLSGIGHPILGLDHLLFKK